MHDELVRDRTRRHLPGRARLRHLLDANLVGVFCRDGAGRITEANDYFLDLLGASRDALAEGCLRWDESTAEVLRKDGTRISVLVGSAALDDGSGMSVGFMVPRGERGDEAEREAREAREALEARVRQAERLESLGVMAGGIAHDFSSLLTSILCNADLAMASLVEDAPARVAVHRIEVTARRAAALTRQILEVAGRGRRDRQPVDLSLLVEDTLPLIEPLLPATARVVLRLEGDLPTIDGDPSQLGQVVMNLLSNAADALHGEAGTIEVGTGAALQPVTLIPSVWLEVTDSGRGMDAQTQARIFEPFFSTKENGRGLGLAAVRGIVRAHGGALDVRSETGLGASFRVWFPRDSTPTGADA